MSSLEIAVTGLGLWLADYPNLAAWTERRALGPDEPRKPTGKAFDRVNRRRASQMGRAIADVAADAMEQASVPAATTPVIVGSAIGEADAMIGLLDQMWRDKEPMSPAVFTVSVHNAASGLLSISAKNKGFTTSIAADYDTPAAVLLEAIGLLATGHDAVAIVCADEESPRRLVEHAPHWDMLAGAIVLQRSDTAPRERVLSMLTIADLGSDADLTPAALPEAVGHNPQAGVADLIDAIQRGAAGRLRLDRGKGRGYVVTLRAGDRP